MQQYVPRYRVAFFESLISALGPEGIDVTVAAGLPDRSLRSRGDSAVPSWLTQVKSRSVRLGSRSLDLSDHHKVWAASDAVIVGLVGASINTNVAILQSIRGSRKIGLWGHVKSYVSKPNRLDANVERWQMRHADHIFAYTQIGADFAADTGVPRSRISAVANTIHTASLEQARCELTDFDARAFEIRHCLVPGRVLAFIGGIDAPKRIHFLADALDSLHAMSLR